MQIGEKVLLSEAMCVHSMKFTVSTAVNISSFYPVEPTGDIIFSFEVLLNLRGFFVRSDLIGPGYSATIFL